MSASDSRPAWSEQFAPERRRTYPDVLAASIAREWAWEGGTGKGVRVGVVDSGIDNSHPAIGARVMGWAAFEASRDGTIQESFEAHEDLFGHGTACAGIIRRLAPDAELISIRVLGPMLTATAAVFARALRWAIEQGIPVINLSLGTTKRDYVGVFHELADLAAFRGSTLVAAANNMPVPSYPSLFSAVVSVAAHEGQDPYDFYYNPAPPVEFGAPGINVNVAWLHGQTTTVTGNSFSAPHITGLIARILSKHPGLQPFELKTILRATAKNARPA